MGALGTAVRLTARRNIAVDNALAKIVQRAVQALNVVNFAFILKMKRVLIMIIPLRWGRHALNHLMGTIRGQLDVKPKTTRQSGKH